ncbi:MAG: tetratricopeptide repeat protein [bacterium]
MKRYTILMILAILVTLAACRTVPEDIPTDMEPAEYFQRAQEAVLENQYDTAIAYYEAVLERFPDDSATQVTARYEIAFVNYKMGNEEEAVELFNELIDRYEQEDAEQLPQWPRVLAEEVRDNIESGDSGADARRGEQTETPDGSDTSGT